MLNPSSNVCLVMTRSSSNDNTPNNNNRDQDALKRESSL